MRIALVTEDGHPYREDTGAIWCRHLVQGLDDHEFHLIGVFNGPAQRAAPPTGVASLTPVPLAGRGSGPTDGPAVLQHRRLATHAAVLLCRGMLDDTAHSAAMFRSALRRLAALAADGAHPLSGVPLAAVLLDAWRAGSGPGSEAPVAGHTPPVALPHPTLRDAQLAADLIAGATRALSVRVPLADVCHVMGGGLGTLVALGALWRQGIPFVLTEYERYQRGPLAARAGARPAVRAVILRFLRALARLGYAEAAIVAPAGERMRRWAAHHGAEPARTRVVPLCADPRDHPPIREEPAGPVLAWLGADHELPLILRAQQAIRRQLPDARLIVLGAGPARGTASVPDGVRFTGPVTGHRALYAMARAVALSGAADLMPYPLIEAMLGGRPVVYVEHGGCPTGIDGAALVVPPHDPARLAAACLRLLTDDGLRRDLAMVGRDRARAVFSRDAMLGGYREIYLRAAGSGRPCASAMLDAPPGPRLAPASAEALAEAPLPIATERAGELPAADRSAQPRSAPWQPSLARLPETDEPTDPLPVAVDGSADPPHGAAG